MSKLIKLILFLTLSSAPHLAMAEMVTYDYQAIITGVSDSSAFGGVTQGNLFSGVFSYDTSISPIPGSSYSNSNGSGARFVLNGTGSSISATLPGLGRLNELLGSANISRGANTSPNSTWYQLVLQSSKFMLNLATMTSNASSTPFTLDSLPKVLTYNDFSSSNGSISQISGTLPTSGNVYLVDRYGSYSNLYCISGCSAPGTVLGFGVGSSYYTDYQVWLAAGNTPLYQDTLWFNVSSLNVSGVSKATTWEGQSPIDFNSANVLSAPNNAPIQYRYTAQTVTLKNTADATIGRKWGSLEATPANENSCVTVGGDKYVLKQFHFHTASEHTVNGVHNPMEMHLVHLKVHDNGKPYCYGEPGSLLVVSALINDGGSKKNAELDKIFGLPSLASLADGATYSGAISPINIQKVLPSNGTAYRYHGSLTEPTNVSCDISAYANTNYNSTAVEQLADHRLGNDGSFPEAVSWVVLSTPITLSTAQIALFKTLFPAGGNTPNGNSRPTQNLDQVQPAIVRNTDRKVLLLSLIHI